MSVDPTAAISAAPESTADDVRIQVDLDEGTDRELAKLNRQKNLGIAVELFLVLVALALAVAALAPEQVLAVVNPGSMTIPTGVDKFISGGVAALVLLLAISNHRRQRPTRQFLRLPRAAHLLVGPNGIVLHHPGILKKDIRMPWTAVRAVSIDGGMDPDTEESEQRFPLARTDPPRYLYDINDVNRVPIILLGSRPATPNLIIVFARPVTFNNQNAAVSRRLFGRRGRQVPVVAPDEQTLAIAMMARVESVRDARAAFLPSGRLRALRPADLSRPAPSMTPQDSRSSK